MTVRVPPSSVARPAPKIRRRAPAGSASSESISTTAWPPRSTRRFARSTASSAACACASGERSKLPPATCRPSTRRHSVTSSGRTPASTTCTPRSSSPMSSPPARAAARWRRLPGGPAIATRDPRPIGASFSDFGAFSFCDGNTGVRSPNQGRSSTGSAGAPFTVSMRTSEGWRSFRRGGRAGPLTSSPARISQRRICAGETYTSSRDWAAGSTRTKPLPLARMSSTPVAISSSEISSSTTSGSSSTTSEEGFRPRPPRRPRRAGRSSASSAGTSSGSSSAGTSSGSSSDVPSEVPSERVLRRVLGRPLGRVLLVLVGRGVSVVGGRWRLVRRRRTLVGRAGGTEDRADQVVLPHRAVALQPQFGGDLVEVGQRALRQLLPVQHRHSGAEP